MSRTFAATFYTHTHTHTYIYEVIAKLFPYICIISKDLDCSFEVHELI